MKPLERVLVLRWFRRKPKRKPVVTLFHKCLAVHMAETSNPSALR